MSRVVTTPFSGDDAAAAPDGVFHLFVYGTLRTDGHEAGRLQGCERVADAVIEGTLYDLGDYPALLLYGSTPVRGEVWRCPLDRLPMLDEYEGADRGLFRRIAIVAADFVCWAYVAGPALARQLTPDRRRHDGIWRPASPA